MAGLGVATTLAPIWGASFDDAPYINSTSGLDSASSCASALYTYQSLAQAWSEDQPAGETLTSTILAATSMFTFLTLNATSYTTLCDGVPRALGAASWGMANITVHVAASFGTDSSPLPVSTYSAPSPTCRINDQDCQALYSEGKVMVARYSLCKNATSNAPAQSTMSGAPGFGTPPTVIPGSADTSTTHPLFSNSSCGDRTITAGGQQLLYWPVSTQKGTWNPCDDSDNFELLSGTRTGTGPSTAIIAGVTITSPSVAIQLNAVHGCYTSYIDTLIIPVLPNGFSSRRGIAGASDKCYHRQFRFQDLNYECRAGDGSTYISDRLGSSCYPLVPSAAYFSVPAVLAWITNGKPPKRNMTTPLF
jgi:hypothetical protein